MGAHQPPDSGLSLHANLTLKLSQQCGLFFATMQAISCSNLISGPHLHGPQSRQMVLLAKLHAFRLQSAGGFSKLDECTAMSFFAAWACTIISILGGSCKILAVLD